MELASRWKRLGGAVIDSLISLTIMVPIMFVSGVFSQIIENGKQSFGTQLIMGIIGFVIFLAINGYFLSKSGQTVGKLVMKTRIVDEQGNLPEFGKLVLMRYGILWLLYQIPFIGGIIGLINALMIFGSEKKCLHDRLAKTMVVDA